MPKQTKRKEEKVVGKTARAVEKISGNKEINPKTASIPVKRYPNN